MTAEMMAIAEKSASPRSSCTNDHASQAGTVSNLFRGSARLLRRLRESDVLGRLLIRTSGLGGDGEGAAVPPVVARSVGLERGRTCQGQEAGHVGDVECYWRSGNSPACKT
jgi:hypothetical protein